jgi:serine/threonine-protein kinase HipA
MNKGQYATPRCPGSLKEGFDTYCPAILRKVFQGKQVHHILEGFEHEPDWRKAAVPAHNPDIQAWYRLKLVKNKLVPDRSGDYLLKTNSSDASSIRFPNDQAANEHLCMVLAQSVFSLQALPCALIFFSDGKPAIIYRYRPLMDTFQSFESLGSHSGQQGKRKTSFMTHATLLDRYGAASLVLRDWYFRVTVFLWLVANGGEHAKDGGVVKTARGDYGPAPLCGIFCGSIHALTPELCLPGGLFEGDTQSPGFRENGHYTRTEFELFGSRLKLPESRVTKMLDEFAACRQEALLLSERAFMPDEARKLFAYHFGERIERLK